MRATPGLMVLFVQGDREVCPTAASMGNIREHPAIITRAHTGRCVNLTVFFDGGYPTPRISIMRDDLALVGDSYWRWPAGQEDDEAADLSVLRDARRIADEMGGKFSERPINPEAVRQLAAIAWEMLGKPSDPAGGA